MALESTAIWMELNTKASGKKISNTETVLKRGQMVRDMKASISRARSMESANLPGLMAVFIKGSSLKTISKVLENTTGLTEESTTGHG